MTPTPEQARWYLAGLIDGEGSVCYNVKNGYRECAIYNTSDLILDFASLCLDVLKVTHLRYAATSRGHCQEIRITRRADLQQLYNQVPLASMKKQKLFNLLQTYKRVA